MIIYNPKLENNIIPIKNKKDKNPFNSPMKLILQPIRVPNKADNEMIIILSTRKNILANLIICLSFIL